VLTYDWTKNGGQVTGCAPRIRRKVEHSLRNSEVICSARQYGHCQTLSFQHDGIGIDHASKKRGGVFY
jgi:hypothetical protein